MMAASASSARRPPATSDVAVPLRPSDGALALAASRSAGRVRAELPLDAAAAAASLVARDTTRPRAASSAADMRSSPLASPCIKPLPPPPPPPPPLARGGDGVRHTLEAEERVVTIGDARAVTAPMPVTERTVRAMLATLLASVSLSPPPPSSGGSVVACVRRAASAACRASFTATAAWNAEVGSTARRSNDRSASLWYASCTPRMSRSASVVVRNSS